MSTSFIIRDGLETDIPECLQLDSHYETDYVWQVSIRQDVNGRTIDFKEERLPRSMEVEYLLAEHRLKLALPPEHGFLVAVGKGEPVTLGCLTMRHDPTYHTALVQDIVVDRAFRRRRIGSRLLRVARQWALERDLTRLNIVTQTKNYPGIAFCQKAGFAFCGYDDQYFPNQDIAVFFSQTLR